MRPKCVYKTRRDAMCTGDDKNCPDFELHHRKFREMLDLERRSFLRSSFAAAGGAAAMTAGGISLVTPQMAAAAEKNQPVKRSYHHLPANADTVHWGYFSKKLKPQVEIDSGDLITIEALTHHANDDAERMVKGDPGAESVFLWTKERKGVNRRGAGQGDVIELRIIDVAPRPCANPQYPGRAFGSNAAAWWGFHYKDLLTEPKPREVVTIYEVDASGERNWAKAVYNFRWTPQTDPSGVVHKTIDYPGVPVDHSTIKENHGILKNVRIPIRPHFGVIGLAPKEADFVDSIPPGYFGGNMDNWRVGKGAIMYYPIAVPGGLFSIGDSHAAQGDSELCGTAIECSLNGTFQIILHKKADLVGTALEALDYPMLETKDEWLVHGFSFANYLTELGDKAQSDIYSKSSVDLALRDAFRKMRKFLMTTKKLNEDEAISLITIGVDFGITQVVDGNWGVHAVIKKDIFAGGEA